jgi:uncharacterized protein YdhG (YjbR/CyaY superfamily)
VKERQRSAKRSAASAGLTAEERAAMKETLRERRVAASRGPSAGQAEWESDLLAKIAEMAEPDRTMAKRIHAIVKASAPALSPRTWYGMPGYAKDGKVVCFFQSGQKFKSRYATLGFQDRANLDDGPMWPTSFALTELTDAVEAKIAALVKQAAS